ncbi:MAG TPA: S-methyl-5-thioribose-1-phosphate isomerase [Gemmatimonadaceae bacterium]|nr:S-methyl-5-thioribose-1-phosphate isomerase [Gemmatimonadaceae bacterium]
MPSVAPVPAVTFAADDTALRIVDQTRLPGALVELQLTELPAMVEAIQSLRVRGAPAIGVAGAVGLAVLAARAALEHPATFDAAITEAAQALRSARPTAVNLAWAVDRVLAAGEVGGASPAIRAASMRDEATAILAEDVAMCARIGEHGATLLRSGMTVLTHCNAGSLATAGIGTALAPVYTLHARGDVIRVFADETRPLLQGARLTAWELDRAGIPVTLLTDGMAASVMRDGRIDAVLVGADRIAANGDVANKIGTYGIAVLAMHHGIPFYVLAPESTLDPDTPNGAAMQIEMRAAHEVRSLGGVATAPDGVPVHNPAFDVTPASLVTAIVTDRGVFHPPFQFTS